MDNLKKYELQQICREKKIKNHSNKNKQSLINLINEYNLKNECDSNDEIEPINNYEQRDVNFEIIIIDGEEYYIEQLDNVTHVLIKIYTSKVIKF